MRLPQHHWVTDITYIRTHGTLAIPLRRAGFVFGPRGGRVDESAAGPPGSGARRADGGPAALGPPARHSILGARWAVAPTTRPRKVSLAGSNESA